MDMGLAALLLLLLVVALGFVRKVNVGLLAIAAATILGYGTGQFSGKEIIGGFSASLFMTLLGVTLFFGIIQENGCIEYVMRRLVGIFGKQVWMAPVLVFLMGFLVAAIGPGCVPAMAFAAAMAVPLAHETGYNPVMLLIMGNLGTYTGRFSAITPEGVLISTLLKEQGLAVSSASLVLSTLIGNLVLFILVFIVYKGYQVKGGTVTGKKGVQEKMRPDQAAALISVAVMILMVIFLGMDVGLASFLVSGVLILLKIGDEGKAVKSVPWNTLVMVCGVGVLMNLVISTGGIDMLANSMSSVMTPRTAAGIMGVVSAVMSWFSSAIGVVYPTLIPTVGTIVENVGGNVSAGEIVTVIALFASVAGLSPASTGGAIIMGACGSDEKFNKEHPGDKLFVQLLAWAVGSIVVLAVMAFIGVFGWFC